MICHPALFRVLINLCNDTLQAVLQPVQLRLTLRPPLFNPFCHIQDKTFCCRCLSVFTLCGICLQLSIAGSGFFTSDCSVNPLGALLKVLPEAFRRFAQRLSRFICTGGEFRMILTKVLGCASCVFQKSLGHGLPFFAAFLKAICRRSEAVQQGVSFRSATL